MKTQFWLSKWQKNEIGFHQETYHPALKKYFPKLNENSLVLVPLCGKSKDMLWLEAQGYQVVGIELAESAVIDFFTENELTYTRIEHGDFIYFHCVEKRLLLVVGDFFNFDLSEIEPEGFDALYDRAALVALPENMRSEYVKKCRSLLNEDAKILLISFSYEKSAMQGPPFSIPSDEISTLWEKRLELLESFSLLRERSKFIDKGLEYMDEQTWIG